MGGSKDGKSPKKDRSPSSMDFLLHDHLGNSYRLTHSKNLDNFLFKIGVENEARQRAVNLKPVMKLTKKHKMYTLTTTYSDEEQRRIPFELGKPKVRELNNGTLVNSLFLIKDNKLVETQYSEDRTIVITRTFTADSVVVTMAVNNEKCERYYKLIPKEALYHARVIKSETSRRPKVMSVSASGSSSSGKSEKSFRSESEIEIANIS